MVKSVSYTVYCVRYHTIIKTEVFKMNCANCGTPLNENEYFCPNCGAAAEKQENGNQNPKAAAEKKQKRDKMPKKEHKPASKKAKILLTVLAAVIAAVAVIIGVAVKKSQTADSTAPVIYVKENSVMVQSLDGDNPFVLTKTYSAGNVDESYTDYIVTNEQGNLAIYPDSITDENGTVSYKLYYRDIDKETSALSGADSAMGILLSTSVYGTAKADAKFDTIAYLKNYDKNEGGKLRVHNLKNEINIDSNVTSFYISDNGKYVVYTKLNGSNSDLYRCKIKKKNCKPELLKSNILSFYMLADKDFSVYAYINADNILNYVDKKGNETLVANGVTEAFALPKTDKKIKNIYYYLTSEEQYLWQEILFDDMYEADSENTAPTAEQKAEIDKRNAFRTAMAGKSMSRTTKFLYWFNDESKSRLCDNVEEIMLITDDYIVYKGGDGPDFSNLKMSDMAKYDYDFQTANEKLIGLGDVYVRYKTYAGNPVNLTEDYKECKFVTVSDNERFFYLMENFNETTQTGDLYRFDAKNTAAVTNSKIDAGVSADDITLTKSGAVYYRKNASSAGSAELYVCMSSKPTKVVDGIYSIYPAGYESVMCLADLNDGKGTLYLCEKSKAKKIDTDVVEQAFAYRDGSNVFYIKSLGDKSSGNLCWSKKGKDAPSLVSEYVSSVVG